MKKFFINLLKAIICFIGFVLTFIPIFAATLLYDWVAPANGLERIVTLAILVVFMGGLQVWFIYGFILFMLTFLTYKKEKK